MQSTYTDLIDIGCNLTHESFDHDRKEVIEAALKENISTFIITGACEKGSIKAQALAKQYPHHTHSTAGIHPHEAKEWSSNTLSVIEELTQNPEVVALGEMGLDFNRNYSSPPQQEHAFEQQLELACKKQYPVFLHQRDAHERFLSILKVYTDKLPKVVVHCFTDTQKALFDYLDLDCYIGITGWICDERRGIELQNLVHNIPLNRLMIETDAPYLLPRNLSPKPKTRRNEPKYLPLVLEKITQHRPESIESIATATTSNARCFFNLKQNQ